ncbi:MAG: hypothetical protein K2Q97_10810 [Burkholderiaceae bacterium]|nr:hypothetical protein [Burkholderiaceae bacterium]
MFMTQASDSQQGSTEFQLVAQRLLVPVDSSYLACSDCARTSDSMQHLCPNPNLSPAHAPLEAANGAISSAFPSARQLRRFQPVI